MSQMSICLGMNRKLAALLTGSFEFLVSSLTCSFVDGVLLVGGEGPAESAVVLEGG